MKFKTKEEALSYRFLVNKDSPFGLIIKNEPIEVDGEFTFEEEDLNNIKDFYKESEEPLN